MPETPRERRRTSLVAPLLTLAAVALALWPYTTVIKHLAWAVPSVMAAVLITVIGLLMRWLLAGQRQTWSTPVTICVQVIAFLLLLTWRFAPYNSTIFAVIPTRRAFTVLPGYFEQASYDVWFGSAPLTPNTSLAFVIALIFGTLTIALDHLIVFRVAMPAAGAVVLVAAIPAIATRQPVDLAWFVLYAVFVIALLRYSVPREPGTARRSALPTAAGIGIAAIAATVVLAPGLPVSAAGLGANRTVVLGASLNLGEDLRNPGRQDVITLATATSRAPYLRIATLSDFDGETWTADASQTHPLADPIDPLPLPRKQERVSTSIRVQNVSGQRLPVPYAAVAARGLSDEWEFMPENRTIVTASTDVRDQDYTITSYSVQPTLDEVRADRAGGASTRYLELPEDIPPSIEQLARDVTADLTNDYDRLAALQSWFRSQFRYSLQTPVDEGFDGTGADAVAVFLERRTGYCIHFASAFALMARTLDMPARIVVGFLPGNPTGEMRGEESLFSVTSDKLHAWPEVHFAGWGWIPFEPTASLGVPTQFTTTVQSSGSPSAGPADAPDAAPAESGATPGPLLDETDEAAHVPVLDEQPPLDPAPFIVGAAVALLLLTVPFVVRTAQRQVRVARAARGDVAAAWAELRDALIDQGAEAAAGESPRARGRRLHTEFGADAGDVERLITAVERASYARQSEPVDLSEPLRRVLRQVRAAPTPRTRLLVASFPRSLLQGVWGREPSLQR